MEREFFFCLSEEDLLLVKMRYKDTFIKGSNEVYASVFFEDEGALLRNIFAAELSENDTRNLFIQVILAISGRTDRSRWISITADSKQLAVLELV